MRGKCRAQKDQTRISAKAQVKEEDKKQETQGEQKAPEKTQGAVSGPAPALSEALGALALAAPNAVFEEKAKFWEKDFRLSLLPEVCQAALCALPEDLAQQCAKKFKGMISSKDAKSAGGTRPLRAAVEKRAAFELMTRFLALDPEEGQNKEHALNLCALADPASMSFQGGAAQIAVGQLPSVSAMELACYALAWQFAQEKKDEENPVASQEELRKEARREKRQEFPVYTTERLKKWLDVLSESLAWQERSEKEKSWKSSSAGPVGALLLGAGRSRLAPKRQRELASLAQSLAKAGLAPGVFEKTQREKEMVPFIRALEWSENREPGVMGQGSMDQEGLRRAKAIAKDFAQAGCLSEPGRVLGILSKTNFEDREALIEASDALEEAVPEDGWSQKSLSKALADLLARSALSAEEGRFWAHWLSENGMNLNAVMDKGAGPLCLVNEALAHAESKQFAQKSAPGLMEIARSFLELGADPEGIVRQLGALEVAANDKMRSMIQAALEAKGLSAEISAGQEKKKASKPL